MKTQGKIVG